MRSLSLIWCAATALAMGALACARNQETGRAVLERDSTAVDTMQNPPGYRGIERDTTMVPPHAQQPVDTFLQNQGVNPRADTAGYSGIERDTTKRAPTDTARAVKPDSVVKPDSMVKPDSVKPDSVMPRQP